MGLSVERQRDMEALTEARVEQRGGVSAAGDAAPSRGSLCCHQVLRTDDWTHPKVCDLERHLPSQFSLISRIWYSPTSLILILVPTEARVSLGWSNTLILCAEPFPSLCVCFSVGGENWTFAR